MPLEAFLCLDLTPLTGFWLSLEVMGCRLARVLDGEDERKWGAPPFILGGDGDGHGGRAMATNGFYKGIE